MGHNVASLLLMCDKSSNSSTIDSIAALCSLHFSCHFSSARYTRLEINALNFFLLSLVFTFVDFNTSEKSLLKFMVKEDVTLFHFREYEVGIHSSPFTCIWLLVYVHVNASIRVRTHYGRPVTWAEQVALIGH